MTIPNLVADYQKQKTVTQLKKAFTTVSQAVKLSELDNGIMEDWNYTLPAKDFYNTYLKNYIKSSEEVPQSEIKKRIIYRFANGDRLLNASHGTLGNDTSYTAKIADGIFISVDAFYAPEVKYRGIIFDLNGFSKPNRYGRDVFSFEIRPNIGISTAYPDPEPGKNEWSSCYQSGYLCGTKIIHDGWQIKDDYPW